MNIMNTQKTDQTNHNNDTNDNFQNGELAYLVRWIGISLIIVTTLIYLAYQLGSNENKRMINQLNKEIQLLSQVNTLDKLVTDLGTVNDDLKLSSNQRIRLTELLDEIIQHKSSLKASENELQQVRVASAETTEKYENKLAVIQTENIELKSQMLEIQTAMSYSHGTVKNFTISVNDSFSMLPEATSRIGLQRILNNGSAQIYVGNALMFFHIGHTIRFRFAPNWLCDVTLIKIDGGAEQVEFEYVCELNK